MNILFLASDLSYPPHGGRSQRTFHTLKQAAQRHRVHFVAFDQALNQSGPDRKERAVTALSEFCESVSVVPLPVKYRRAAIPLAVMRSLITRAPYSAVIYRNPGFARAVESVSDSHPIDLLHNDSTDMAEYRRFVPDAASVLVHHNVESLLMARRAPFERGFARRSFVRLEAAKLASHEARFAERYDVHVAVSQKDALRLPVPRDRLCVVPNGVDVEYFRPSGVRECADTLVHVGAMGWAPNRDGMQHFLRETWPLIKARRPQARLRLAGSGSDTLSPPEEADSIEGLGYVDDIRPLVDESAVYVVPLRFGGGTRLKILDAMAMGKAIVSTSIGCEGLSVRSGRDIIVADEPEVFAREVCRLLNDPDARAAIGAAARETVVERYAWPVIGEAMEQAYEYALGTHRRTGRVD